MRIKIINISQIAGCATRENYMPLAGTSTRDPVIPGNSILIEDSTVIKIGMDLEEPADRVIDAENCLVTPGFTDNHTHLVFGGSREDEFEQRAMGAGYKEIAKKGGGIKSSVRMTRETSFDDMYQSSRRWLNRMLKLGVTSIEIKSGYGLDLDTEMKQLRVIEKLKSVYPGNIRSTFLGAHEIPPEYKDRRDDYIEKLMNDIIPHVGESGLADYIDVFCEKGVYSGDESIRILRRGMEYGMKPRLHADEIDTSGGSSVAAAIGALSADHMNVPDRKDLGKLAENATVITLLPATNFLLKVKKKPPVEDMRRHGNIIAVSTDFNPGSSPVISLMLAATIGMINYSLLPVELIYAVTLNPSYSLELGETAGSVQEGRKANLLVHDIHNYKQLFYFFGMNTVKTVIIGDEIIESC